MLGTESDASVYDVNSSVWHYAACTYILVHVVQSDVIANMT